MWQNEILLNAVFCYRQKDLNLNLQLFIYSGSSGDESDTSHGALSSLDVVPRSLEVIPSSPSSDSYYNKDSDKKVSWNIYQQKIRIRRKI